MVTRAVTAITQRLNSLAMLETGLTSSAAEASPGRSTDASTEQPLHEKVSVATLDKSYFNIPYENGVRAKKLTYFQYLSGQHFSCCSQQS
jgi:hypothetical protein